MSSPYEGIEIEKWYSATEDLIRSYPLTKKEIIETVLKAWNDILSTKIANKLQIGKDVFPSPQIMGNYLHELIPYILAENYPGIWRKDSEKNEKDLVYIPNNFYSTEIKTSSSANGIFGNRSYGQLDNITGKGKSGFYIAINFEKFDSSNPNFIPKIKKIRLGWLDHTDWQAQKSETGQQSSVSVNAKDNKMILLYSK